MDDGDFWYHYHGYKTCGDDKPIERCRLACEKLLVFPLLTAPCVEPEVVEFGGSLRAGTYQSAWRCAMSSGLRRPDIAH